MATYYVANSGNNSNAGSQAAPWETLAYALTQAVAGDTILLKRGDVFSSMSIDSKHGTVGSKYVVGAYGSGSRPKISAFKTPASWTNEGSNIYSYYDAGFENVTMLRLGGVTQSKGRWPQSGWYDIQNRVGNTEISDSTNLNAAPNFVGGELVSRKNKWIMDANEITAQTSSTITVAGSGYNFSVNYGYFVQNHINCLTYQGAWCYNATEKKVYIYSTSDPAALGVQVSFDQYSLYQNQADYYDFDDLSFEGSYEDAGLVRFSDHVNFNRCKIRHHGFNGITTYVSENLTIDSCYLEDIQNNAANLVDASHFSTVRKSRFKDIAVVPGSGGNGDGEYMCIFHGNSTNDHLVEDCNIDNTGYIGVYFRGNNTTVRRNIGSNCCQLKADGAVFYSFGHGTTNTNVSCTRNIALNTVGNLEGTTGTQGDCAGFYLDDGCVNVSLTENYAKGNAYGIYLHNNQDCLITDNYSLLNTVVQLRFSDDDVQEATTLRMRNLTVTGNKIKAGVGQLAVEARTIGDYAASDPFLYGVVNNNNIDAVEATPFRLHLTDNYDNYYDLNGWRSNAAFDLNSTTNAIDDTEVIYLVNDTEATDSFPLTKVYKDWDNIENDSGTISLDPNESILLFEVEDLYFYTAGVNPAGYGTADVSASPVRLNETVTLTATPATGKQFVKWTQAGGDFAYTNPFSFTPLDLGNASADLVAEFEDIPTYTVGLTTSGSGTATEVSTGPYAEGDPVEVQATPAEGWQFDRWEEGGVEVVGAAANYQYTQGTASRNLVAVFSEIPPATYALTTAVNNVAWGSAADVTNTGPYEAGEVVNLQATPAEGYYFVRWTVDGLQVSDQASYAYTMPSQVTTITAVFAEKKTLSLVASPTGSGTLSGAGSYALGEVVSLEATPASGWVFSYWMVSGQVVSDQAAFDYSMASGDVELTAFFEATSPSGGEGVYTLNGINMADYGIFPSQAPGSNIAVAGAWDLPARIGKTHHSWPDQDGVEPYVREDEIFHEGRTILFYGLVEADDFDAAINKVMDFYEVVDAATNIMTFSSPYGSWNVHVREEITAKDIAHGWWEILLRFRETEPVLTGTIPTGDSEASGLDGVPWSDWGLIPLRHVPDLNRPAAKEAQFTIYGKEGYGRKKRGLREYSLRYLLQDVTYTGFRDRLNALLAVFKSPGLRTLRHTDGTYREVFCIKGFEVTDLNVDPGQVTAVVTVQYAEVRLLRDWNLLTDNEGNLLTDNEGRPLFENLI